MTTDRPNQTRLRKRNPHQVPARHSKRFTLAELCIVIMIITTFAAIILRNLNRGEPNPHPKTAKSQQTG